MSFVVVCSCGAKFKAKPEHVGKKFKCPKCGGPISVSKTPHADAVGPKKIEPLRDYIEVTGVNEDAVEAMREFLTEIRKSPVKMNPFRHKNCQIKVTVDDVYEGNAFLRYMFLSLLGRPRIRISLTLMKEEKILLSKSLTASAFLQERRDAGFRGGAFGGSNISFIRTTCRKLSRQIASLIVQHYGLPNKIRLELMGTV